MSLNGIRPLLSNNHLLICSHCILPLCVCGCVRLCVCVYVCACVYIVGSTGKRVNANFIKLFMFLVVGRISTAVRNRLEARDT